MSLKSPTVSVIISTYQGIKYLPATIKSILQQTYTNFEVLIFSHDYIQITSCFDPRQDSRLKVFFPENLSIAETFNQGILRARGKYISFVNVGDLWRPNKLRKQVFCLDLQPQVGLVYSWLMLINHHGKSTGKIIKLQYSLGIKSQIEVENQLCLSSVMVRRRCFECIGLFDTKLKVIPAWDLWLRLSQRYQLCQIAETLVYWRKHQSILDHNWLIVETDLQATIEKAYTNAPPEQLSLKNRSYACASLFLASNVLQHQNRDPAIAINYCYQALQHDPLIGFSPQFLKVRLAILTLHYLKGDRYSHLLLLIEETEVLLRNMIYKIKVYSHSALEWMLEEEERIIFGKPSKVEGQGKD